MATDNEMNAGRDAEIAAADAVPTQAFNVVVIGGGPAGMAAALAAHEAGARVAIVERERHLGVSSASASTRALACRILSRNSPVLNTRSALSTRCAKPTSRCSWTAW